MFKVIIDYFIMTNNWIESLESSGNYKDQGVAIQSLKEQISLEQSELSMLFNMTEIAFKDHFLFDRIKNVQHLYGVWGKAIPLLHTYYLLSNHISYVYNAYLSSLIFENPKSNIYICMLHINGRALQIFKALICLLENGFAHEAMGYQRALFEMQCLAEVICSGTDEQARFFIKDKDKKFKSEKDHYNWLYKNDPPEEHSENIEIINKTLSSLNDKYGLNIDSEIFIEEMRNISEKNVGLLTKSYGINTILKKAYLIQKEKAGKDISFAEYTKAYNDACLVLHPSPKGIFNRFNLLQNAEHIVVGETDAGLFVPAINSTCSPFNINNLFLSLFSNEITNAGICALKILIDNHIEPMFKGVENRIQEINNGVMNN